MRFYDDMSQTIGRTPLVRINKLNPYPKQMILAKIESFNPGGSVKDRVAKSMLDDAERQGILVPGKVIIEPTSGNTGIGIAMLSALRGYQCELVMPESMSIERRKIMLAYGAKVTLTPAVEGTDGSRNYVNRMLKEEPDRYISLNQYDNPANWQAHYQTTALEILSDTDNKITHFVAGLGTSGTLMGMSRALKEKNPDIQIISVESIGSSLIQGLRNLENSQIPRIFDSSQIDQRLHANELAADRVARSLGTEEGIFSGQSAGAAMWGALEVARELEEKGEKKSVIVVLLADSGERYISGMLFDAISQPEIFSITAE
ncbi:MAG: cysteine synthase family protein [Candidatus Thorarchaeota archaeon]